MSEPLKEVFVDAEKCLKLNVSKYIFNVAFQSFFFSVKHNQVSEGYWSPTLEYYSSYNLQDFIDVTTKLATIIIGAPNSKYQVISLFKLMSLFHIPLFSPSFIIINFTMKKNVNCLFTEIISSFLLCNFLI